MKKRIVMLLCTAVLTLGLIMAPAMASRGPFYPIEVEEYTYGPFDELRINKVYQLSLSDDPSGIPTGDFERNGRLYYLLDMIKENVIGVDTQEYTETVTMDSDTNDLSTILKQLDPHLEITTEDGHTGLLALDYPSVTVEVKGYKTSTRSLSATRTYPGLSDADLDLIPKTITDSGNTLTLGAVEWSNGENGFYTVAATYTGTATSRYATGYTVTANYTGQVTKTSCEVVTYTAVFGCTEMEEPEPEPEPTPTAELAPDTKQPTDEKDSGTNWLSLLGCAGGVVTVAAVVFWAIQSKKRRRART